MKIKYFLIILILIFSLFLLSGCYDASSVETLAYAVALGIDRIDDNTIRLTLQFAVPSSSDSSSSSSQSSSSTVIDVDCSTIDSGISLVNSYISKKVNLSHCKAIVISEELAYHGLSDYIYTLINNIQIRPDCYIIISRCDAYYYLDNSTPTLESVPARYYELILNSSEYSAYAEAVYLTDFYQNMLSSTAQAVAILGGVNTDETQKLASNTNMPDGGYKADETPLETNNVVETMGLAVFTGDTLVGELNGIETLCHMIVSNELKNATITIPNPYDYGNNISVYISPYKNTKRQVKVINESPYINCDIYIGGYVLNLNNTLDLTNPEVVKNIDTAVESYLKYCISSYLYKTAKEFHSDIDNFGKYVRPNYLTWEKWSQADWLNNYENSFFDVNVTANIKSGYLFNKF